MTDGIRYATAKALLQEHFGNEHVIASAYMDKIFAWPAIKSEDGKALQAYSLFLRGCHNAMKDVYNLSDLNTSANMVSVIKKLPYKLRDKWRAKPCDIQEKHRKRTMFADIVTFIEREVRITTDPVFGDIQDAPVIGAFKESGRAKPVPRPKVEEAALPKLSLLWKEMLIGRTGLKMDPRRPAFSAKRVDTHTLESCFLLEKKAHSEKMEFLKKNGVCFGCLCTGHISNECRKRLSCKTCGSRHPACSISTLRRMEIQRKAGATLTEQWTVL